MDRSVFVVSFSVSLNALTEESSSVGFPCFLTLCDFDTVRSLLVIE